MPCLALVHRINVPFCHFCLDSAACHHTSVVSVSGPRVGGPREEFIVPIPDHLHLGRARVRFTFEAGDSSHSRIVRLHFYLNFSRRETGKVAVNN